jgi:hypothetical protein
MKFIKSRFPKLSSVWKDIQESPEITASKYKEKFILDTDDFDDTTMKQYSSQGLSYDNDIVLAKAKALKHSDYKFKKTLRRFYPKIDIAVGKRLKAKQIKLGEDKTKLQTKVPTNLPKRLSPVSTFTTSFGKNVKAKITKLKTQAYNLALKKEAKEYSRVSQKLGIEKSYKGPRIDENDVLRSNVNTDARVNVMDSENVNSATYVPTANVYKKDKPTASEYVTLGYTVKSMRKGKPTSNFITRSTRVSGEDLKFGIDPKTSSITKKQYYVSESQTRSSGRNLEKQKVYNFHKVNKPNINFNKQSIGQTTSGKTVVIGKNWWEKRTLALEEGKTVLGKKLGDNSNKYNRTRNFKRSFSRFKITPKE